MTVGCAGSHSTKPWTCGCGQRGLLEFDGATTTTWCPKCGRSLVPRTFPLLYQGRVNEHLRHRRASVPWAFLAPHEKQAQRNHSQTLARLAERGGLSPREALLVVEDRPLRDLWTTRMTEADALDRLEALLKEWKP